MGWQEDYYGKVYKSPKTYNAAQKAKKTKKDREYATYDNATRQSAQEFARQNGIQYSDKFYNDYNKAVTNKYREQDYNKLNEKHQQEWTKKSSQTGTAPYRQTSEENTSNYNKMRKELGYSKSSGPVSNAEFNRLEADYNNRQETGTAKFIKDLQKYKTSKDMKVNHNEKKDNSLWGKIESKGKHFLQEAGFINQPKQEVSQELVKTINSQQITPMGVMNVPTKQKDPQDFNDLLKQLTNKDLKGQTLDKEKVKKEAHYNNQVGMNVANTMAMDLPSVIYHAKTGKNPKFVENEAARKEGETIGNGANAALMLGGIGAIGEGIGKLGVKGLAKMLASKQGLKAAGIAGGLGAAGGAIQNQHEKNLGVNLTGKQQVENIAKNAAIGALFGKLLGSHGNPTRAIEETAQQMNTPVEEVAKIVNESPELVKEQVKPLTPKQQNLQNIKLPNGKIEVQPTVKKSLNDLMGKTKKIDITNPEDLKKVKTIQSFLGEPVVKESPKEPGYIIARQGVKDEVLDAAGKPQGLYTSMVDDPHTFVSPHEEFGDVTHYGRFNPKNVLDVQEGKIQHERFKRVQHLYPDGMEYSAGIGALKRLSEPDTFEHLITMNKDELVNLLNEHFPGPDYSQYHDSYELLEALGGQLARKSGFDAIKLMSKNTPELSEIVALKNDDLKFMPKEELTPQPEKPRVVGKSINELFKNMPKREVKTTGKPKLPTIQQKNDLKSLIGNVSKGTKDEIKQGSSTDNLQNAITKARQTNNPEDIKSISKRTEDLIKDINDNYVDDVDAQEVKDDLMKLNLQLFAGKIPTEETLAAIEGVSKRAKSLKKDIKETNPKLANEIQQMKDISTIGKSSGNLYEVVKRLPKAMQNLILPVLEKSKIDNVNYQKYHTNELNKEVVSGLGIKKGSKESALVQDYGEKTLAKKELEKQGYTPEQIDKMKPEELSKLNDKILKEQHPDEYFKIKKADKFFSEKYKELLANANKTLAQIYPGQPDKLIPERSDYYHHFNEMEGLEGVINQFRTPENIDPALVNISHGTKPKTKWQAFRQKRGLGEYKSDAVGGFLKYLQGVSHTTHVDPVIPAIRNVVKDLENATSDTKNINNIIESLNDHADDIAGKTNPYDRTLQKFVGRANFRRITSLNNRVKANMILGNVSSAVAQVGNVPLVAAKAKQHMIPGLTDTLHQFGNFMVKSDKKLPIDKSTFMKERFIDEDFSKFDQRILDQPKKLAVKMMQIVDKAGSALAWNSMYRQGLAKKVVDPIKYADAESRKLLGGRGIGEMGLGHKSKTAQIFMPFTYEVGNQWKVLNEMVGKKDAVGIMTFLIASYGLNKAIEQVRGSGVSYDPIDAVIDGYKNKTGGTKDKVLAALGSLAGETVGNIPGGNLLTSAIGDKKLFYTDTSLNDVFQDRSPNRFGTGLTMSKAVEDPLLFGIPSFGGNQIKKTLQGYHAIKDEGVFDKKGDLMYPIENPSLMKMLQLGLFGKYATKEGRNYFDNKRKPLTGKTLEKVMGAKDRTKAYYDTLEDRINNSIKRNRGNAAKLEELKNQLQNLKNERKEMGK